MKYSFIANTGIQFIEFEISIDISQRSNKTFLEEFDPMEGQYSLRLLQERPQQNGENLYYIKEDLVRERYISRNPPFEVDWEGVDQDGKLYPFPDVDALEQGKFTLRMSDGKQSYGIYEKTWLPLPYFRKRGVRTIFEAFNWVRCMLLPIDEETKNGTSAKRYRVILAVDTHSPDATVGTQTKEAPVFEDDRTLHLDFSLCERESLIMDYCAVGSKDCGYIERYLREIAHPGIQDINKIRDRRKMNYLATYVMLISSLAEQGLMPQITLYRDSKVLSQDIDMIIDIGNSRTTCILSESGREQPFNGLNHLELIDYSLIESEQRLVHYNQPFDMRVTFRRTNFGRIGYSDSRQFLYPSLVRVGLEAVRLSRLGSNKHDTNATISFYSSPKRYLWDERRSDQEWSFLRLPEEEAQGYGLNDMSLITRHLDATGRVLPLGQPTANVSYRYSRRSLMTFALLEMLQQARTQANSAKHREHHGNEDRPRLIKRILLTCPTTMSALERKALVTSMQDAVELFRRTSGRDYTIEIIPQYSPNTEEPTWYFDEATCAQLVYLYSEMGYKYQGAGDEFIKLYGHKDEQGTPSITIGSLDIGAGTSDLMICNYSINTEAHDSIRAVPLFYDSFYQAGDDMLYQLIRELLLMSDESSLRLACKDLDDPTYRQRLRNFCGPDYNTQSVSDRNLRCAFNLQVLVPVMHHFLELFSKESESKRLYYGDIFIGQEPNVEVADYLKEHLGIELKQIEWIYNKDEMNLQISSFFEDLIKRVSAILYAHQCDVVLLSGRPASLSSIRNLFLRYYSVAPNRLITLNQHHIGDWYPFGDNTGYITNPKTIITVGAMVGLYGSVMSRLPKFTLDTSYLGKGIKSVTNYVERPKQSLTDGHSSPYCFTPSQDSGEIKLHHLPDYLYIKQLDSESYPSRQLFCINYNPDYLSEKIKRQRKGDDNITEGDHREAVRLAKDKFARRFPLTIRLERNVDGDDPEKIVISDIEDREGGSLPNNLLEVSVQSLGSGESYWLDNGVYNY